MGISLRGWARPRSVAARLAACEQLIGHDFNNVDLLRQALDSRESVSRRLAVVGDRAVETHLAYRWWRKHDLTSAQWNELRTSVLSNENLSNVGFRMGINDCTLPDPCDSDMTYRMATTIEAVLAAVWLDTDRNITALERVIDRLGLTHRMLDSGTGRAWLYSSITSSRTLPRFFFSGHHLALIKALSESSQPEIPQRDWTGGSSKLTLVGGELERETRLVTSEVQTTGSIDSRGKVESPTSGGALQMPSTRRLIGNDEMCQSPHKVSLDKPLDYKASSENRRSEFNGSVKHSHSSGVNAVKTSQSISFQENPAESVRSRDNESSKGDAGIDSNTEHCGLAGEQDKVDQMRVLQKRIKKMSKKQNDKFSPNRLEILNEAEAQLKVLKNGTTATGSLVNTGSDPITEQPVDLPTANTKKDATAVSMQPEKHTD